MTFFALPICARPIHTSSVWYIANDRTRRSLCRRSSWTAARLQETETGNCSQARVVHTLAFQFPFSDSKVHGANIRPTWGRQDPGGPHVGPMNLAIWELTDICNFLKMTCNSKCSGTRYTYGAIHYMIDNFVYVLLATQENDMAWIHSPNYWLLVWGIHGSSSQWPIMRSFDGFFVMFLRSG